MILEQPKTELDGKQLIAGDRSMASDFQPNRSTSGLPQRWHLEKTDNGRLRSDLNISSEDGTILNAVSTRLGWRSGVAIYQDQDKESEYLATAKISTLSFVVSLPSLESSGDKEIKMKSHWRKTLTPRVEWQMPVGKDGHLERFEWASSSGRWKSIRQGPSGNDLVARWTVSFISTRRSGEFESVGAGATGELGEAFPLVASVSALAIGKLMRDTVHSYVDAAYSGATAATAS